MGQIEEQTRQVDKQNLLRGISGGDRKDQTQNIRGFDDEWDQNQKIVKKKKNKKSKTAIYSRTKTFVEESKH